MMHKVLQRPCVKCATRYRGKEKDKCRCLAWRYWFSMEWNRIQREAGLDVESPEDIDKRYREKSQWEKVYREMEMTRSMQHGQ